MTVIQVLRPIAAWGRFTWVHLEDPDHPGQPLCGPSERQLCSEEIADETASICPRCAYAQNHFQVKTIRSGQARAYQDTHYVYEITDLEDPPRDKETVLAFCQAHVMKSYQRAELPSWSSPELVGFSETKTGWCYHVRLAYTG